MNAVRKPSATHKPLARRTVIVGLGRTGLSCARYLSARGARIAITDTRRDPPELGNLGALAQSVELRLGGLDQQLLADAAQIVVSPGVALTEPFLREAQARGIEIVGDVELFARAAQAPVIAVTGTNGKSTVTTLVAEMVQAAGLTVRAGGNLGEPALNLLAGTEPDFYVLELSSFQLETTHSLALRAAAVLNVSADHLDRYVRLADYATAKARIFAHCDVAVVNLDDELVRAMPRAGQAVIGFSIDPQRRAQFGLVRPGGRASLARAGQPLLALDEMRLTGLHNAANALAALALCEALGLPREPQLGILRTFTGLPHRMQWVADLAGVRWINDSKGTNVGATLAAVGGMEGPLIVIAGGDGKNQDFATLAEAFRDKVRAAVLIGRDAPTLARVLEPVCAIDRASSLEEAVRLAAARARPGDTVLLSPACASLDMFRDYTHRGAVFAAAVRELAR
ncbi:MAG TPA: UDP-N-acetylmuramoyl-L-alanine--D-glutamate ligase [Steroidobacteraceae bacterium]|nr:UDP-N-acetylmuramoyl-L-alanine--D-glutamate ligase [Steroidobacteraceae bacterium]